MTIQICCIPINGFSNLINDFLVMIDIACGGRLDYIETVMPGQAPIRHENGSWVESMRETLIACKNGCTDMREAHFHIKTDDLNSCGFGSGAKGQGRALYGLSPDSPLAGD